MKRLKELKQTEISKKLMQEFNIKNSHAVPVIEKITINVGIGKYKENHEFIQKIAQDIFLISGQKPQVCKSKKAISGFKLRQGEIVGLSTTLRGKKMYEFLEKVLNIVLPRVKDFRGLSTKSFDSTGNYTFAIKENIVFPEISYENIENIYGMQICVTIKNSDDKKQSERLLELLGFPFKKDK